MNFKTMITYELAKQLKDVGFPQDYKNGEMLDDGLDNDGYGPEIAYAPTLEELIEACGNPFMLVWYEGKKEDRKDYKTDYKGVWQAFDDTDSVCDNTAEGDTHSEAVAKLWLKLNKNE